MTRPEKMPTEGSTVKPLSERPPITTSSSGPHSFAAPCHWATHLLNQPVNQHFYKAVIVLLPPEKACISCGVSNSYQRARQQDAGTSACMQRSLTDRQNMHPLS